MTFPRSTVICVLSLLNATPAFSTDAVKAGSAASSTIPSSEDTAADEWGDDGEGTILESSSSAEPADGAAAAGEWGQDGDGTAVEPAAAADPVVDEPSAASAPATTLVDEQAPAVAPSAASAEMSLGDREAPLAEFVDEAAERRVGEPVPLTRRAPLLPALGLEVAIRYGLVGTGPTRFINDIRFGVFDWLELRTTLAPYPASLMARVGLGDIHASLGQVVLEGGLAYLDAGLRLAPEQGEPEVGVRAHVEGALTWQRAILRQGALYAAARWRSRLSMLSNDEQHAIAAEVAATYDLLPYLALTGGVGYAQTLLDTPVRELAVNFIEHDRPGMSQFLVRNDGEAESLALPVALTYGRVENFDVDLFVTTRVWPRIDVLFGAGVRWRWGFGRKPWEARASSPS